LWLGEITFEVPRRIETQRREGCCRKASSPYVPEESVAHVPQLPLGVLISLQSTPKVCGRLPARSPVSTAASLPPAFSPSSTASCSSWPFYPPSPNLPGWASLPLYAKRSPKSTSKSRTRKNHFLRHIRIDGSQRGTERRSIRVEFFSQC
jgi:hypothetical protein